MKARRISGGVSVGDTKEQTYTIQNTGTADLTGLSITKDGPDASQFDIVTLPLAPVSGPYGTTGFSIRFSPTSGGSKLATFHIASNDPSKNPFDMVVTGVGIAGEISIFQAAGHAGATELASGAVTRFGECLPEGSSTRMFTIYNKGEGALMGFEVSVAGDHAGDFTLQLADLPTVLQPGHGASFGVTFVPEAEGERSALLSLSSNDADQGVFDIGLEGTGIVIPSPFVQQAYLKAFDANSREFGSDIAMSGDTLVVGAPTEASGENYDAGAVYVYTRSGDNWFQQAKITPATRATDAYFGYSVTISGNTLLIGAPGEADWTGKVYVFVRNGNQWTQEAMLEASNAESDDGFGWSVGISGETAVVAAPWEASQATGVNGDQSDNSAPNTGASYVFVRSAGDWTQQSYLKPLLGGNLDQVTIFGETIAAGGPYDATSAGGVNVFIRNGVTWSQQAYLEGFNTDDDDYFGNYVSLSGNTLAVGANGESSESTGVNGSGVQSNGGIYSGAAYVFTRTGTTWTQEAYLKPSTFTQGRFGSVCVSGDTMVVGAYGEDSNALGINGNQADQSAGGSGAAYVFTRTGGTWSQRAYLKASNADRGDLFGWDVAVCDGTVAVGALSESSDATGINGNQANNRAGQSGAVYLFNPADPTETFQHWATIAGIAGLNALPGAAPFNDGISNLLKYAFNMNGSGPDVRVLQPGSGISGLPAIGLVGTGSATMIRVEFLRRKNSGLIYTPKRSNTLQPGSFGPMTGTPVVTIIPLTGEQWERVIIEEPADPSVTPRSFVTVEVTMP